MVLEHQRSIQALELAVELFYPVVNRKYTTARSQKGKDTGTPLEISTLNLRRVNPELLWIACVCVYHIHKLLRITTSCMRRRTLSSSACRFSSSTWFTLAFSCRDRSPSRPHSLHPYD